MKVDVLILAGGSSRRMNGINKQLAEVGGAPVVIKSALAFESCPEVNDIIIAAQETDADRIRELCREYGITKLKAVTVGGDTRVASAKRAFGLSENADIVLVHDGARPYIKPELIRRLIGAAEEYGAAVPCLPVTDTVKVIDREGFSRGTPARSELRAVQTPQAFGRELYERMMSSPDPAATDDSKLAEQLGAPVKLIDGDPENIKITTRGDLPKEETRMMRIGHGYDVHRLAENRKLIIGGVTVPYELGLLGHSDADVLVHAIMDAMLGALALGDIGQHFPDKDDRWKGADSIVLLKRVNEMIKERGFTVSNLDCTINAEKPKLAKYITDMRANIASALGISADLVSVKATTEEGLGLAGAGIGATAVCLLESRCA
ncbi:MAG: 2-C-methyl-D-erythritol 2,4-cyclodiphosphate synthase [Ruminiclostridium sp.]|nr:2-C-methyl-D-erythritol 2,4-cyclodiphosphate synthase [Ruminiclostridium sp.]